MNSPSKIAKKSPTEADSLLVKRKIMGNIDGKNTRVKTDMRNLSLKDKIRCSDNLLLDFLYTKMNVHAQSGNGRDFAIPLECMVHLSNSADLKERLKDLGFVESLFGSSIALQLSSSKFDEMKREVDGAYKPSEDASLGVPSTPMNAHVSIAKPLTVMDKMLASGKPDRQNYHSQNFVSVRGDGSATSSRPKAPVATTGFLLNEIVHDTKTATKIAQNTFSNSFLNDRRQLSFHSGISDTAKKPSVKTESGIVLKENSVPSGQKIARQGMKISALGDLTSISNLPMNSLSNILKTKSEDVKDGGRKIPESFSKAAEMVKPRANSNDAVHPRALNVKNLTVDVRVPSPSVNPISPSEQLDKFNSLKLRSATPVNFADISSATPTAAFGNLTVSEKQDTVISRTNLLHDMDDKVVESVATKAVMPNIISPPASFAETKSLSMIKETGETDEEIESSRVVAPVLFPESSRPLTRAMSLPEFSTPSKTTTPSVFFHRQSGSTSSFVQALSYSHDESDTDLDEPDENSLVSTEEKNENAFIANQEFSSKLTPGYSSSFNRLSRGNEASSNVLFNNSSTNHHGLVTPGQKGDFACLDGNVHVLSTPVVNSKYDYFHSEATSINSIIRLQNKYAQICPPTDKSTPGSDDSRGFSFGKAIPFGNDYKQPSSARPSISSIAEEESASDAVKLPMNARKLVRSKTISMISDSPISSAAELIDTKPVINVAWNHHIPNRAPGLNRLSRAYTTTSADAASISSFLFPRGNRSGTPPLKDRVSTPFEVNVPVINISESKPAIPTLDIPPLLSSGLSPRPSEVAVPLSQRLPMGISPRGSRPRENSETDSLGELDSESSALKRSKCLYEKFPCGSPLASSGVYSFDSMEFPFRKNSLDLNYDVASSIPRAVLSARSASVPNVPSESSVFMLSPKSYHSPRPSVSLSRSLSTQKFLQSQKEYFENIDAPATVVPAVDNLAMTSPVAVRINSFEKSLKTPQLASPPFALESSMIDMCNESLMDIEDEDSREKLRQMKRLQQSKLKWRRMSVAGLDGRPGVFINAKKPEVESPEPELKDINTPSSRNSLGMSGRKKKVPFRLASINLNDFDDDLHAMDFNDFSCSPVASTRVEGNRNRRRSMMRLSTASPSALRLDVVSLAEKVSKNSVDELDLVESTPLFGLPRLSEGLEEYPVMIDSMNGNEKCNNSSYVVSRMQSPNELYVDESSWRVNVVGGVYSHCVDCSIPLISPPRIFDSRIIGWQFNDKGTSSKSNRRKSYFGVETNINLELVLKLYNPLITGKDSITDISLGENWYWFRCLPGGFIVSASRIEPNKASTCYYLPYFFTRCEGMMQFKEVNAGVSKYDASKVFDNLDLTRKVLEFLIPQNFAALSASVGSVTSRATRRTRLNSMEIALDEIRQYKLVNRTFSLAFAHGLIQDHCKRSLFGETNGKVSDIQMSNSSWLSFLSRYPSGKFLSEGACKKVYCVASRDGSNSNDLYALSCMDVNDLVAKGIDRDVVKSELEIALMCSALYKKLSICPNFVQVHSLFLSSRSPPDSLWNSKNFATLKDKKFGNIDSGILDAVYDAQNPSCYLYSRMEFCDRGDLEDYVRHVKSLSIDCMRNMLFQMCFSLYTGRATMSLRHYDIKLLNFFGCSADSIFPKESRDREALIVNYGFNKKVYRLNFSKKGTEGCDTIVKLADFGTSSICSGEIGDPITEQQFTTLENTPIDFFLQGSYARQSYSADTFCLGLCYFHMLTGNEPYEVLLEDVKCPEYLRKKLRSVMEPNANALAWKELRKKRNKSKKMQDTDIDDFLVDPSNNTASPYHILENVLATLQASDDLTGEEQEEYFSGNGSVFYDTLYRYFVLFFNDNWETQLYLDFLKQNFEEKCTVGAVVMDALGLNSSGIFDADAAKLERSLQYLKESSSEDSFIRSPSILKKKCVAQFVVDTHEWSLKFGSNAIMKSVRDRLSALNSATGTGSNAATTLLCRMLHFDPNMRCTMYEALQSEVFNVLIANTKEQLDERDCLTYMHYASGDNLVL